MKVAIIIISLLSAFTSTDLLGNGHAVLVGKVLDRDGNLIDHATVLIYYAGVKHGYSTFCPSCYADCGKRTITGSDGRFTIKNVDPNLWFELLAARNGYQPVLTKKVDPSTPSDSSIVLLPRLAAENPEKVLRGRVVDGHGAAVRDAIIQPVGMSSNEYADGRPSQSAISLYGTLKGVERIATTNTKGEFEIASRRPALAMLLKVEARGFAPKLQALRTGMQRQTVILSEGAVVRGRLLNHGTPVANAEISIIARNRGGFGGNLKIIGNPYDEIRVGTQADGSFVLADVPTPVVWYLYAKMESLPEGLATEAVQCATKLGGEVVNVRDLQLEAGHRLKGRIALRDGAPIPDGMRVIISSDSAWDSQVVPLHSDGRFECSGLPTGSYDVVPSVRGYRPSEAIRNLPIDHDVDDLNIVLEPEPRP